MTESSANRLDSDEIADEILDRLSPDLIVLEPSQGMERYLSQKDDLSSTTLDEYEDELSRFVKFLHREGIDELREISGITIDDYQNWRRFESSEKVLSSKTMRDEMYLIRDFISYLESIEAVDPNLSEKINIPELSEEDRGRDVDLSQERVEDILGYLQRYKYASLDHLIWELVTATARRISCHRALDIADVNLDEETPHLQFRHQPPETPLKNGENSEGIVSIPDRTAKVLKDFIETKRPDVSTGDERRPLLATREGRVSNTTFRRIIYRYSRPCAIGKDCPHSRDPEECEAAQSIDKGAQCPSSRSPHAVRHGHISECRKQGISLHVLSDRVDATPDTIKQYYDETDQEDRFEMRQEHLEEYLSNGGYL